MLSLADLNQALTAYKTGEASLDEFADWYRAAARSKFGEMPEVLSVCLGFDLAFSHLHYEDLSETDFQQELDVCLWQRGDEGGRGRGV